VEGVTAEYRGAILSLQRAFEHLRPEGLSRLKGEMDGDTFDWDRLLDHRVAVKMGQTPTERVYIHRRKQERDVAVAFLVDLSGSTRQQMHGGAKTILQLEKEALVLLSRAVAAVGDSFALYGFSGKGKDEVRFYILKEFEEPYQAGIDRRIGAADASFQNRDGAAIRHATAKLARQSSRIKLLLLLSDGRPLDETYTGSYAIADTQKALSEAKRLGIHPYCVTIDQGSDAYLHRMYGDVAYAVIDRVEALPVALPRIYKRLTT
jgi:nitric oxide reductase activation protein